MTQSSPPLVMYVIGQLGKGGAEQQLYYLLKYTKLKSIVVSLSQGTTPSYWAEPIRELGYKVIELQRTQHIDFRRFRQLRRIIYHEKPKIVTVFGDGYSGMYGRLSALGANSPHVVISERQDPSSNPRWMAVLKRFLNRRASFIITNSYSAAEYLQQHKLISADNVITIVNGIEINRYSGHRSIMSSPFPEKWKNTLIVGTVGSLTQTKAPTTFVTVAAKVLSQFPDVRFVHAGKGPLENTVKELSGKLGIADKIHWLGQRDDIPDLLPYFSLFLLTSQSEGMPNVVLEALAAKLPCVVTNAGDCSRLVQNGVNGYVLPVEDVDGLAVSICHLLDNETLCKKMALEGFKLVQPYAAVRMAQAYDRLYLSLLTGQRG